MSRHYTGLISCQAKWPTVLDRELIRENLSEMVHVSSALKKSNRELS